MDLTEENKAKIDSMSYEQLLRAWRHAPVGDRWFQGETGKYWGKRMKELKEGNWYNDNKDGVDHVAASKRVGWEE